MKDLFFFVCFILIFLFGFSITSWSLIITSSQVKWIYDEDGTLVNTTISQDAALQWSWKLLRDVTNYGIWKVFGQVETIGKRTRICTDTKRSDHLRVPSLQEDTLTCTHKRTLRCIVLISLPRGDWFLLCRGLCFGYFIRHYLQCSTAQCPSRFIQVTDLISFSFTHFSAYFILVWQSATFEINRIISGVINVFS